jgi:hypothetical protein
MSANALPAIGSSHGVNAADIPAPRPSTDNAAAIHNGHFGNSARPAAWTTKHNARARTSGFITAWMRWVWGMGLVLAFGLHCSLDLGLSERMCE